MITRNVAGMRAGGIALKDAVRVRIVNNTIAFNDSHGNGRRCLHRRTGNQCLNASAWSGSDFLCPQPAFAAIVPSTFSNPVLDNDIIYQNRSFFWQINPTTGVGALQPSAAPWNFSDLAVIGAAGAFTPRNCIFTGGDDPMFVSGWFNGPSGLAHRPAKHDPSHRGGGR